VSNLAGMGRELVPDVGTIAEKRRHSIVAIAPVRGSWAQPGRSEHEWNQARGRWLEGLVDVGDRSASGEVPSLGAVERLIVPARVIRPAESRGITRNITL
jgi:hypothetical protein